MDSLQQKPNQKINLLCPQGHVLYKDGVKVGQLYQKYGIRLQKSQLVKIGFDWDKVKRDMERVLKRIEEREGVKFTPVTTTQIWTSKQLKLCPTYQLTDQQLKSWRPCKYCSVTDDIAPDSVQ